MQLCVYLIAQGLDQRSRRSPCLCWGTTRASPTSVCTTVVRIPIPSSACPYIGSGFLRLRVLWFFFFFFLPFASLTRSYSSSYIGTRDPLELELAQPRGGTYWGFWKKKRGTGGWGRGRIRESTGAERFRGQNVSHHHERPPTLEKPVLRVAARQKDHTPHTL